MTQHDDGDGINTNSHCMTSCVARAVHQVQITMVRLIIVAFLVLLAASFDQTKAFSSSQIPTQREQASTDTDVSTSASPRAKDTGLKASLFDDIGKFFGDAMGGGKNDDDEAGAGSSDDENDDDSEDDDYAGSTRLLTIPAKSIKPGGLRLLLMFYCMGMQNTPEQGSWKADQPTNREEYVVDMFFHDRTAMLSITLKDDEITIDRIGSAPSMSYLTQESVIVDGILDELHVCVTQDDVKEEDRLLQLPEPRDAIEKARQSLAFS